MLIAGARWNRWIYCNILQPLDYQEPDGLRGWIDVSILPWCFSDKFKPFRLEFSVIDRQRPQDDLFRITQWDQGGSGTSNGSGKSTQLELLKYQALQ